MNVIWSMEYCMNCDIVKNLFKKQGIEYSLKECSDLVDGKEDDQNAIQFFKDNSMSAPIIRYNGGYYTSDSISKIVS